MKFRGDNVCKRVLVADNLKEMDKNILKTTEVTRLSIT